MRLLVFAGGLLVSSHLFAQSPHDYWTEFKTKRDALPALHQEFTVSRLVSTTGRSRVFKRQVILDLSQQRWRQKTGTNIEIFDGMDLFAMEEGEKEFTRTAQGSLKEIPQPDAYSFGPAEWKKAKEVSKKPCQIGGLKTLCLTLDVPLAPRSGRRPMGQRATSIFGSSRVTFDADSGLLISAHTVQPFEIAGIMAHMETSYVLNKLSFPPVEPALFIVPSGLSEVKDLKKWDVQAIMKELKGQPARDFSLNQLDGSSFTLSAFRGKTVILHFLTTFCLPCERDLTALRDLGRRYGSKDLVVLSIFMGEEKEVVENFLKGAPFSHASALASPGEMPSPYRLPIIDTEPDKYPAVLEVGNGLPPANRYWLFPAYIVIAADGTYSSAAIRSQGLQGLRKLLKDAGMNVN